MKVLISHMPYGSYCDEGCPKQDVAKVAEKVVEVEEMFSEWNLVVVTSLAELLN